MRMRRTDWVLATNIYLPPLTRTAHAHIVLVGAVVRTSLRTLQTNPEDETKLKERMKHNKIKSHRHKVWSTGRVVERSRFGLNVLELTPR